MVFPFLFHFLLFGRLRHVVFISIPGCFPPQIETYVAMNSHELGGVFLVITTIIGHRKVRVFTPGFHPNL